MNTEECPKAPVEDIVYLKRLGGCGAQMKGLLQGAEITRFPCVGMVDPPRGGGSMEMRQPLAEGLGLWVPHAFLPGAAGPCCGKSPTSGLPIQLYLSGGPPHTEKGCWRILFSQRYVFLKTSNSANNDMVTKSTACGSPGLGRCSHIWPFLPQHRPETEL